MQERPVNSYDLAANTWWPPGQAAADDYVGYAAEFDRATCLEHFDAVAGAAGALHVGNPSGGAIARFLRERIEQRVPTSLIRLGDADGNVLFSGLGIYPELTTYNLEKISRIYFGAKSVMVEHREFFFDTVVEGIAHADLVGGPERGTIDRSFDTPYPDLDVRGMCGMRGVYDYLATATDLSQLGEKIWASTWFSRALLPHYFDLVRELPFLGFVTCYPELEGVFRERAGITETASVTVPMQASIAKVHRDIRHYPDAYPTILEQLRPPYEGAVYIVAAGILSKAYCTAIKQRGGIAIDVGSVADVWMGARTRPDMPNDFVEKWRLTA
jgi:hypothetical protein